MGAEPRDDDAIIESFRQKKRSRKPSTPKRANGIADDADHYTIATAVIDSITAQTSQRPVYSQGLLYHANEGIWIPETLDTVAVQVGARYGGFNYCRKGSDFRAIAWIAAGLCTDDSFFDDGPIGIAAGSKFWRVMDARVVPELLAPEHRQRMRLELEPDFHAEPVLFNRLLDHAFPGDVAQRDLLQVLFGAALSRSLWRHRIAVLLVGKTTTGKTTLLNVLKRMFPSDQVAATNPQKWGNEYYRASLAGKALNIVGELDPHEPIPGGAFKSVVGCDVIEGRHPTHRPFSFTCTAAHFFNANRQPPTIDRSDAFFKRWRILEFNNTVADADVIEGLDERIIAEEQAAVLAWMLEGAAMLQASRVIPETEQHRRLIGKWRAANNSALQFILDTTACELDPTAETKGDVVYEAYKKWAMDNGVKAFGRNGFYEAIDEGAGRFGVRRAERRLGYDITGLRLRAGNGAHT